MLTSFRGLMAVSLASVSLISAAPVMAQVRRQDDPVSFDETRLDGKSGRTHLASRQVEQNRYVGKAVPKQGNRLGMPVLRIVRAVEARHPHSRAGQVEKALPIIGDRPDGRDDLGVSRQSSSSIKRGMFLRLATTAGRMIRSITCAASSSLQKGGGL